MMLSAPVLEKELMRLCGMTDGVLCQIAHDVATVDSWIRFVCDSRYYVIKCPTKDLFQPLHDFSDKHLQPLKKEIGLPLEAQTA